MNIIISPLDWGLGHAVRIIPIIRFLMKNNHKIFIAANNSSTLLLKKEFPELTYLKLKPYNIKYSLRINNSVKILLQTHKIIFTAIYEHFYLKKAIKKFNIDIVISDNRYGFFSKRKHSIFITHQISPKIPFKSNIFEKILYRIHKIFILNFNKCLIPDFEDENNISGELSHKYPLPKNTKFIGILSDFNTPSEKENYKYDLAAIISGPEPQRTVFEKKLKETLINTDIKTAIISGKPDINIIKKTNDNITIFSHLKRKKMQQIILESKTIICRSGYTSVMDLVRLNKKAIFVPTPGQTEQEYLASFLNEKYKFTTIKQKDINFINLKKKIKFLKNIKETDKTLMKKTVFTDLYFN